MPIPQAPRPGPSAQNTGQKPRATSVLQLQNSRRRTAIPALSKVDSEGPDMAQDIVHFNALREAGKEAPTLNTPVRRHQYTREFKLAAITYAKEHTSPSIDPITEAVIPRRFSKYRVAQILGISEKMLKSWMENERSIMQMRVGQRKNTAGHGALHPELEYELHTKFLVLRNKGRKVTRSWFMAEARRLYEQYYPERVVFDYIIKAKV
ncbi:hypothetical protein EV426DRAFT_698804 [Tirmania nivea]|nr:hypothetical protein EV426DRAFT_698804 [Tirmania nivea]